MPYAELFCQSNFSFLQGASHPQELVAATHKLDYRAFAITDKYSMAGVVRVYSELEKLNLEGSQLKLICGSFFRLPDDNQQLVLLAPNKIAYQEICQLTSISHLRIEKGRYQTHLTDITKICKRALCLWIPRQDDLIGY